MNGEERRNQIVDILKHSSSPVPGTQLAQILDKQAGYSAGYSTYPREEYRCFLN